MLRRSTHRKERTGNSKGQSLVEFAIMLPVLLLIFGAALDLGRLFYAHVAIENAAKEGALYGANSPACDGPSDGCLDPNNVRWHVETESVGIPDVGISISCSSGSVDDCEAHDFYQVTVTSTFTMVTPILAPLLGNPLQLTSTATSLVVNDAPDLNAPVETLPPYLGCTVPDLDGEKFEDAQNLWINARFTGLVIDSPSMRGSHRMGWQSLAPGSRSANCVLDITVSRNPPAPAPTATPTPGPSATPTSTPGPGATPTPTPTPGPAQCTVPDLVGEKLNDARTMWRAAGFTGALTGGGTNENKKVLDQSQAAGTAIPCSREHGEVST
jgi:hypothetical protein